MGCKSRSPLDHKNGILNSGRYIYVKLKPVAPRLFEIGKMLRFYMIMHGRMMPVHFGIFLIQKFSGGCPGLHLLQITHYYEKFGQWLSSRYLVTIWL